MTRPILWVWTAVLAAACRPEAQRLLVLDLRSTDPVVLATLAEPWQDEGYRVEYRRFYPHLTHDDLARYRTIVYLTGGEPARSSETPTAGDAVMLREWVTRGGVVVVGYGPDGDGSLGRWTLNQWLAWLGAGITIGDAPLADTAGAASTAFEPEPAAAAPSGSPLAEQVFEPFPAGRNHPLETAAARQVLARAPPTAFVRPAAGPPEPRPAAAVLAAARVGAGLVVVTSRHLLAAAGPDVRASTAPMLPSDAVARTRTALATLARWTRRPAEWATVRPARGGAPLTLTGGPGPVAPHSPPRTPPAGTAATVLPRAPAPAPVTARPAWIARQRVLAAWTDAPPPTRAALDSLVGFVESAGLNLLAITVDARALRDTLTALMGTVTARLQTTSVRWIPALPTGPLPGDTGAWCPLGGPAWDRVAAAARAIARARSDAIPVIALDLPPAPAPSAAYCDAAATAALAALGADSGVVRAVTGVPTGERRATLLAAGLLPAYHAALERLVARRAAELRAELLRVDRNLLFAVRSGAPPGDWHGLGLLRGLGDRQAPALLFTREPRPEALLERLRARGVHALHVVGIAPARVRPGDWRRLAPAVRQGHDGFWLALGRGAPRFVPVPGGEAPIAADSLARLVRRLARDR